jgi:hypothetical protein
MAAVSGLESSERFEFPPLLDNVTGSSSEPRNDIGVVDAAVSANHISCGDTEKIEIFVHFLLTMCMIVLQHKQVFVVRKSFIIIGSGRGDQPRHFIFWL